MLVELEQHQVLQDHQLLELVVVVEVNITLQHLQLQFQEELVVEDLVVYMVLVWQEQQELQTLAVVAVVDQLLEQEDQE